MKQLLSLVTLVFLCVTFMATGLTAGILPQLSVFPHYTSFDGKRYDFQGTTSGGEAIADGSHVMIFTIWDDPTAGVVKWTETQAVTTSGGLGSVMLGEVTPMNIDVFGTAGGDTTKAYYLEISLDGEIISPRTRLVSVPFARAAERVLGDIETGNGTLTVSNIGSSGLDGVTIDVEALDDNGTLVVSNIGSSGDDGVRLSFNSGETAAVQLGIEDDEFGARMHSSSDGSGSGLFLFDALSIDSTVVGLSASAGSAEVKLGIEHEDIGARMHSSDDGSGSGLFLFDAQSIDSTVVGLSASAGTAEVKLGIEHEDIGAKMRSSDDGSGSGLLLFHSPSIDSTVVGMSASASGGTLTISNIGSSGEDGVSIDVGSDNPLLRMLDTTGGGTLDPSSKYEFTMRPDRMECVKASKSTGDTTESAMHHDHLVVSNIGSSGIDGVRIGPRRIKLKTLPTAATIETEILAMSLVSGEPIILSRPLTAQPTDPPTLRYEYDSLDRLTRTILSPLGQSGDSSRSGSTGLSVYDYPTEYTYDHLGILIRNTLLGIDNFSVTSTGEVRAVGHCKLAIDPTSSLHVGPVGSLPSTAMLTVAGDICATGLIGPCSDARYKKDIEVIDNSLDKVLMLSGVEFNWRTDEFPDKPFSENRQVGFIAQEVEKVFPEVVVKGKDGYYFVDYSRLTPLLVEAVKDQQSTIESLEDRLNEMEKKLALIAGSIAGNGKKDYATK